MTFKEQLDAILKRVDGMITKDTPVDQITEIGGIKDQLNQLGEAHQQTLDDYGELKNLYIKAVKTTGNGTKPVEENKPAESDEEMLARIGAEIIANRGK